MNIKLASQEDLTITTKGGHTVIVPDADGIIALKGSGQSDSIVASNGNRATIGTDGNLTITVDDGGIPEVKTVATMDQMPSASGTTPQMDGSGAAGTATTYARGDHVHPTDTSRAPIGSIAPEFDESASYAAGAVVYRADTLWHSVRATGPGWVSGDWVAYSNGFLHIIDSNIDTAFSAINSLTNEKAPLASPVFTGTPTAPDYGSSPATTSQVATVNYVSSQIGSIASVLDAINGEVI